MSQSTLKCLSLQVLKYLPGLKSVITFVSIINRDSAVCRSAFRKPSAVLFNIEMSSTSLNFMLENGLNLRDVATTGSVLHINQDYDEGGNLEINESDHKPVDILGEPVSNFAALSNTMVAVDQEGFVKKKILDEGGGLPLHEGCTVSIAYSGYFEHQPEPFDVVPINKPMVQDLSDNGLLPGLEIAVKSMLVGETSVFLLSYKVMYGEMGVPPRIKAKADCLFYIKAVKSILTPTDGKIVFSEPNMFQRVNHEVKLLYASGNTLFKTNNYVAAIQLFKKAVFMLHKCRLADEKEEQTQEKMLKKLYINLVICYNKVNKPLMACTACNELNRLKALWNNGKVLFQNAKALRMIGEYDEAEKKLLRAIKLSGENDLIDAEYKLLESAKQARDESKLAADQVKHLAAIDLVSNEFKAEVDELIRKFKESETDYELILPLKLNSDEMAYVKEVCIRENLFYNKIKENKELDKKQETATS